MKLAYFSFLVDDGTNMAAVQIYDVGATLSSPYIGSLKFCVVMVFV